MVQKSKVVPQEENDMAKCHCDGTLQHIDDTNDCWDKKREQNGGTEGQSDDAREHSHWWHSMNQ